MAKTENPNVPPGLQGVNTARANNPIRTINELKAAKSPHLVVKETRQANKSYKKKWKMPNYSFFNKDKIYFIVRHHQIQIHAQQQAVNSFNISFNITDSNNMTISKKSAVKTFIYYICMIVWYLPYLSYSLVSSTSVKAFGRNWSFVYTVVFLNSSVNPFLYCWCNREIRSSVVKVVRKMMCRETGEAS